jgi:stage IV sporulation protein FB
LSLVRWSYRLGRFFGIDVRVHLSFPLLLAYVGFSARSDGATSLAALLHVLFVLAVFVFVVMHEYGHALTARRFGIRTREITLYPVGGVAMLEGMPRRPQEQLWIALAGPAVNFALAAVFALFATWNGATVGGLFRYESLWSVLFMVNVMMGAFNLLPALPMDGGRVLKALLAMRMEPLRATAIAARVARYVAVLMALWAMYSGNVVLIAIAMFVYFASGAEQRMAEYVAARTPVVEDGWVRAEPVAGPGVNDRDTGGAAPPRRMGVRVVQTADGPRLQLVPID